MIDVGLLPWPRTPGVIPPDGYTDCGCIGCENKSYEDHILKDLDEEDDPTSGNLHLEEVYTDSDDDDDDDDTIVMSPSISHTNDVDMSDSESLSSALRNDCRIMDSEDEDSDDIDENERSESSSYDADKDIVSSRSYSPADYDPFDSYDYES